MKSNEAISRFENVFNIMTEEVFARINGLCRISKQLTHFLYIDHRLAKPGSYFGEFVLLLDTYIYTCI